MTTTDVASQFARGVGSAFSDLTASRKRKYLILSIIFIPLFLWFFESQTHLLHFWHIERKLELVEKLSLMNPDDVSHNAMLKGIQTEIIKELQDSEYLTLSEQTSRLINRTIFVIDTTVFKKVFSGAFIGLVFIVYAFLKRSQDSEWDNMALGGFMFAIIGGVIAAFIPTIGSVWVNYIGVPAIIFIIGMIIGHFSD